MRALALNSWPTAISPRSHGQLTPAAAASGQGWAAGPSRSDAPARLRRPRRQALSGLRGAATRPVRAAPMTRLSGGTGRPAATALGPSSAHSVARPGPRSPRSLTVGPARCDGFSRARVSGSVASGRGRPVRDCARVATGAGAAPVSTLPAQRNHVLPRPSIIGMGPLKRRVPQSGRAFSGPLAIIASSRARSTPMARAASS